MPGNGGTAGLDKVENVTLRVGDLAELRDLGTYGPELQLDLAESVVESSLTPANDEPNALQSAREEGHPPGESAEDPSVFH